MKLGAFTFVLHSHLPYARKAGRWPHGEEWIHEAATETYIPLLAALHDLADEGVSYRLTIGVTPVLAEQLADADVIRNLEEYLEDLRERAATDIARFGATGDVHREGVARFHTERFTWLLDQFRRRFAMDLIGALRSLQDRGYIEIAGSAATHGYLPLFERDSAIHAQIHTGVRAHRRHFGASPRSFWLPECAYRPAIDTPGAYRPGLEDFLAAEGITAFFVETGAILGGRPATGASAIGPYGEIGAPKPSPGHDALARTTFQPYRVARSTVAAIGRNNAMGEQVWSADRGYPGDPAYREFHKKDDESGLHYWRVTGRTAGLGEKQLWDPEAAFARVDEHARHFAALVEAQVHEYHDAGGRYGIVSAAYDTELFGHWWFEGIAWLRLVLRHLAASDVVDLTGAAQYIEEHPPKEAIALPEGSWGREGTHVTWQNAETAWMWQRVDEAQRRMEHIVAATQSAIGEIAFAVAQAARELLLLESSDWPFLVTTGQAREYAERRFNGHAERFDQLADQIEAGFVDMAFAAEAFERDKVFTDIDPRDFAERQGMAGALEPALQ